MDPFVIGLLLGGGAALAALIWKWWVYLRKGIKLDDSSVRYVTAGVGMVIAVAATAITKESGVGWTLSGVLLGFLAVVWTDHLVSLALRQRRRRNLS